MACLYFKGLKKNISSHINNQQVQMGSNKINEPIQIYPKVFYCTWAAISNDSFIADHQISMIAFPPSLYADSIDSNCVGNPGSKIEKMEFRWIVQENRFSGVLLKYKCQAFLQKIAVLHNNQHGIAICDQTLSSQAAGICCLILMTKFNWTLLKTIKYLNKIITDLDFSTQQIRCLLAYDKTIHSIEKRTCAYYNNEIKQDMQINEIQQFQQQYNQEKQKEQKIQTQQNRNKHRRLKKKYSLLTETRQQKQPVKSKSLSSSRNLICHSNYYDPDKKDQQHQVISKSGRRRAYSVWNSEKEKKLNSQSELLRKKQSVLVNKQKKQLSINQKLNLSFLLGKKQTEQQLQLLSQIRVKTGESKSAQQPRNSQRKRGFKIKKNMPSSFEVYIGRNTKPTHGKLNAKCLQISSLKY